jgi:hypothetical protein
MEASAKMRAHSTVGYYELASGMPRRTCTGIRVWDAILLIVHLAMSHRSMWLPRGVGDGPRVGFCINPSCTIDPTRKDCRR